MEILKQYINNNSISTLIFFIFINIYAYNFFILNICLVYFTYYHLNVNDNINNNINDSKINEELILFFSSDKLEYQEIDYKFDIGNYMVNIMVDNDPLLFIFTLNYNKELGMNYLCSNKISYNYNSLNVNNNALIHFKCENNKISILPDQESVLSIKVIQI